KTTHPRTNGKHYGRDAALTVDQQDTASQSKIQNLKSKIERNPGTPLDLDWVYGTRINRSAVERRAATLVTRRTVKKEWQAAWLLRAITDIDLTTLSGDDTPGNVLRLCAKAQRPVRQDILEALGAQSLGI